MFQLWQFKPQSWFTLQGKKKDNLLTSSIKDLSSFKQKNDKKQQYGHQVTPELKWANELGVHVTTRTNAETKKSTKFHSHVNKEAEWPLQVEGKESSS